MELPILANAYTFEQTFTLFLVTYKVKVVLFMILLQTDTLEMYLQKNKGHFIIADINRSFTNCLDWIALKYFLSIID